MRLAEALGRGELEVPILVLDAGAFVRDDLDAGLERLFEYGLQRLLVVRDHANHVDLLGDQIFDRTHLQGWICAGRPDHVGVDAVLRSLFFDPGLHRVKPRDATDLNDDTHRGLVGCKSSRGKHGGEGDARQHGASGCRDFHHNVTNLPLFATRANCGSIDPAPLDRNSTQNSV